MTAKQHQELVEIVPYDREFGAKAYARRHGMTVRSVYHWRKKFDLPVHDNVAKARRAPIYRDLQ